MKMAGRTETIVHCDIYHVFVAAFTKRLPRWAYIGCNSHIIRVCLLIEQYDRRNHSVALLRGGTHICAIPRDCSHLIFKHLVNTRWDDRYFINKFVGQRHTHIHEGSGIVGRPDPNKYVATLLGDIHNVFYGLELVFTCNPGKQFAFLLCGHYHSNGIVLSGRSAELFNDLWSGAVALAGPMIVPQQLHFDGRQYSLCYYYRGYLLAKTFIKPGKVRTYYFESVTSQVDYPTTHDVYSLDIVSREYKRRIFSGSLP